MSDFAGDDLFVFDDFGDGAVFDNDPFDGDGGDTVDEFCVSGFAFPDGDDGGEFCVSAFSFPEGDENMVVHDHASQASDKDPVLETLGRSFDSDEEGLSVFIPDLVCAISSTLDLNENSSGEEPAGGDEYVEEFILGGGPDRQPGLVIEEATGDDSEDFFGFMPSEIDLDPQPVTGGFQTLVDVDEGVDVVAGDDDHLRLPAFRMLVEDVDSDGDDILEVLALRAGQIHARSPLSASRAVVEALPEVAPTEEEASSPCAVCKDGIAGQLVVRLPCKHFFHGDCIRPWLLIRNTCPVCRIQLPTGNPEYDRQRPADGGASPVQDGAMPQTGGAGGRTNVISEDAPGCSGGGN